MSLDKFWEVIDAQLDELRTAKTGADVLRILATEKNPYGDPSITSAHAFFAGGGGDETPAGALSEAGWHTVTCMAPYHWIMQAPNGDRVEYVEGDVYVTERGEA